MTNFTQAQAYALFDALKSAALSLNIFQAVNTHEPISPPPSRLYCSITLGPLRPATSGMNFTSGQVTFPVRIWSKMTQRPLDTIDAELLYAAAQLMGALSGEFTLEGTVRNIDLMQMSATPGWVDFEGEEFRVMEISVPIVINDLFAQEA